MLAYRASGRSNRFLRQHSHCARHAVGWSRGRRHLLDNEATSRGLAEHSALSDTFSLTQEFLAVTHGAPRLGPRFNVVDNLPNQGSEISGNADQLNVVYRSHRGDWICGGDFNATVATLLNDHVARQDRADLFIELDRSVSQLWAACDEDEVGTKIDSKVPSQSFTHIDFGEDYEAMAFQGFLCSANGILETHVCALGEVVHSLTTSTNPLTFAPHARENIRLPRTSGLDIDQACSGNLGDIFSLQIWSDAHSASEGVRAQTIRTDWNAPRRDGAYLQTGICYAPLAKSWRR
jgi:hypothetical protein